MPRQTDPGFSRKGACLSHRCPIIRIGWRSALKGLEDDELKLLRYADGHAELLARSISWSGNHTGSHSYAYFYLTKRSVELLDENSKKRY